MAFGLYIRIYLARNSSFSELIWAIIDITTHQNEATQLTVVSVDDCLRLAASGDQHTMLTVCMQHIVTWGDDIGQRSIQ